MTCITSVVIVEQCLNLLECQGFAPPKKQETPRDVIISLSLCLSQLLLHSENSGKLLLFESLNTFVFTASP